MSSIRLSAPIAVGLTAALVTAVAGLSALTFWNVYARPAAVVQPNVAVADVPVGGVAHDEVQQLVRARLERYADTTLVVTTSLGPQRFTAAELGYRPELAATFARVEALGVPLQREAMLAEWRGDAPPRAIAPVFSIDDAKLDAAAAKLAAPIDRPAVDARLRVNPNTSVELLPATSGQRVDRAELRRRLQAAFRSLDATVALPVHVLPPAVTEEDARPAKSAAEQLLGAAPLEVRAADAAWTLSRGDLASWIVFTQDDGGKPRLDLQPDRPRNWLVDRANEIGRPARGARLKLVNGKPTVAQLEQSGLEVDRAGALAALRTAVLKGDHKVELPVKTLAPTFGAAQAAALAFPDVVAAATTSYAGGLPERNHNVELAASRVDGTVVPSGAVFSFNDVIGRTRLRDGYQVAYGIVADPDGVQTVPAVAGGICQVATTLFHAAFWAGLPIVERHEHPYWIPRYGMAPSGLTGLDTTVDEDSGLDFQFKNTTAGPLLIRAATDGAKVSFQLLGVKPDWKVEASQPSLTNFVKTDATFQRQEDPTLEAGRAIQIEEARDGFDALVARTVTRGGAVLDRLDVRSHYEPSHNVVLVGTRKP